MSSSENVELAHIAYDVAYVRRRIEGDEDRFTDDFTWHQRAEWPGRSVYPRDELTTLWEDLDGTYSEFTLEPVEFEEIRDCVVAVRDARLAEVRVYSDRREAL